MARPIVRAAMGITLSKAIVFDAETIADAVSTNYDTLSEFDLIQCAEAIEEEVESTGAATASVPVHSRLLSMKLNLIVRSQSATLIRWIIMKKPDGESLLTSLADASFHGRDDTQNQREARRMTIAKGILSVPGDRLETRLRPFIRRAAWARVSPMRENDKITLIMAKDTAGSTGTLDGFGTIYAKANG